MSEQQRVADARMCWCGQAACRELEEREVQRLMLEAQQRRHQEDSRAEADRRRLNHLIATWRGQFAELIETVRWAAKGHESPTRAWLSRRLYADD